MSLYTCPRCGYTCRQFTLFFKHCNRLKYCQVAENKTDVDLRVFITQLKHERNENKKFICEVCKKKYSTRASLKVHTKKFHNKNENNEKDNDKNDVKDENKNDMKDENKNDQNETFENMKKNISFGEEDLMFMFNNDVVLGVVNDSGITLHDKIKTLIKMAYFNEAHIENQVVRYNVYSNFINNSSELQIKQDGVWHDVMIGEDLEHVLTSLTEKIQMIIHHYNQSLNIDTLIIEHFKDIGLSKVHDSEQDFDWDDLFSEGV